MTTEYSIQKMVSDGTLSTISLGIQYLQRNDIYMRVAGEETPQSGAPSGYTWSFVDNTTLKILPVVPNGVEVVVYRRTDVDAMYNTYSQNAQFDEATIDENNQQLLYIAQEYLEQGLPGAGVDTLEYVRDDGSFTYYRMRRTDGSYSEEFPVPSASNSTKVLTRESLRRSYAEAGYNLVDGSFEAGGTLVNANDVLLQERTGKAFSGPAGTVAAGTNPASVGFVDKSGGLLRHELATSNGATKVGTSDGGSVQDFIDSLDAVYSRVFDSRQSMINYSEHAIGSTYSVSGEKIETFKVVDYISDVDLGGGLYASKIARSAGMTISDLPSPFFIAHQGGVLIYPSHSMEAYVGCESIGVMAVEEDCHKLLDGALACHHDNTVDKTTNGTGKVIDFSSMGWKGLKIDAQNWFGGDVFTDLDTVTLGQVFSEIGNRMVHVPEAKSADSGQAVVNEIIKYGLERSSIVQASSTSNLDAAIAQGIPAMLISSALTPQQMIDYGIEYVGLGTFESDSTILSYVNAGIKVVMYTQNRHVDRDRYDALGVSGYFSDDPLYISKEGYRLTSDPFKNKTYYHGHLGNNFDISTRGYFQNGGWGFPVRAVSKNFVLQGWGCPIENAGGSYTIAGSITFDDSTVGSDSANIAFAALTDANFQDAAASTDACYHAIFRTSGLFILYRMEGRTYTSLGSTQMAAITTGDTITFTIDVTPSSIVITRTDIAAPNRHSTNDTTYRGGYFHFGRNTAGVTFKDISIT